MGSAGFQGATRPQKELLGYWRRLCRECLPASPRRRDIDAGVLRAYLANLSIIEVLPAGMARFRLAGSALCDATKINLSGQHLDALPRDLADFWRVGLMESLESGGALGGIVERSSTQVFHAWLRIPLEGAVGSARQILCHDEFIPLSGDREINAIPSLILEGHRSIAA